jgi:predicted nucleic acid-binding protein
VVEIRNLLLVAERRSRISVSHIGRILFNLAAYPISIDLDVPTNGIVDTARRRSLTIYDASYVELAMRLGYPLATLDKQMASAALAEKVDLVVVASQ